jgi:Protein of unknown function (DUF3592)
MTERRSFGMDKLGVNIGIFFALLAVEGILIGGLVLGYFEYQQVYHWPRAVGRITDLGVVDAGTGESGEQVYAPLIEFTYTVGEETYEGDGDRYNTTGSYSIIEGVIGRWSIDQKVEVAYDPEDPVNAVMEPALSFLTMIFVGVGLLLNVIGMVIFRAVRKRK